MAAAAGSPGAAFECNICLETAREPVVSVCGHLYCWPCLHQWLETRPERQECPVCKAGISRENVIPIYGRGDTNQKDPRLKTPPRPQGQRPEPENRSAGERGTPSAFSEASAFEAEEWEQYSDELSEEADVGAEEQISSTSEEEEDEGVPGFTDTGFHMSFGIGAFPFGFFTTVFNANDFQSEPRADNGLPQGRMFGLPDSLFLIIAAFFFLWLISV